MENLEKLQQDKLRLEMQLERLLESVSNKLKKSSLQSEIESSARLLGELHNERMKD